MQGGEAESGTGGIGRAWRGVHPGPVRSGPRPHGRHWDAPSAEFDPEWDSFVEGCPGGDLVQTSAWVAAKRRLGLKSRLVSVRGPDGVLVGGAQIVIKKFAPRLAAGSVARGPLIGSNRVGEAARVIETVLETARSAGLRLLIVQPPEGCGLLTEELKTRNFQRGCPNVAPEATIRLDVRLSEDDLLAAMMPMRRRNIAKALRSDVEISVSDDVAAFQALHAATAARQGFHPLALQTLQAQWAALQPENRCFIVMAFYRGVPIAGLWLTSFAGTVTFKLAGWDTDRAKQLGAPSHVNEGLQWAAIRHAKAAGAQTYDFGGFDRAAAESLIAGRGLPASFKETPSYFKFGFCPVPTLLPQAQWAFIGPGGMIARPILRYMFSWSGARAAVARVRNG